MKFVVIVNHIDDGTAGIGTVISPGSYSTPGDVHLKIHLRPPASRLHNRAIWVPNTLCQKVEWMATPSR